MISSVIRYVGSKSKGLDCVLSAIPKDIEEYREPMIGSGSVLLGLLQTRERPKKIAIGDFDSRLYNMWISLMNRPSELTAECIRIRDLLIETKDVGLLESDGDNSLTDGAKYIISNIIKRFGNYGEYLTLEHQESKLMRFEENYKYKIFGIRNLINEVEIHNDSYEWALRKEGNNVCVFLDPPYYNVTAKEGYYKGHKEFDFDKLTSELINTKHRFIMTIDKSEYSEDLKEHFYVEEYSIFYSMSKKTEKEYIVSNFKIGEV